MWTQRLVIVAVSVLAISETASLVGRRQPCYACPAFCPTYMQCRESLPLSCYGQAQPQEHDTRLRRNLSMTCMPCWQFHAPVVAPDQNKIEEGSHDTELPTCLGSVKASQSSKSVALHSVVHAVVLCTHTAPLVCKTTQAHNSDTVPWYICILYICGYTHTASLVDMQLLQCALAAAESQLNCQQSTDTRLMQ